MARTNLKVTDGIAIDFYDDGNSNKGSIYLDNGAFVFSGTSGGDVVIGEVGNGADLVFEENSTIHGQGGNTLTFGQSGDSLIFAVDTTFNANIDFDTMTTSASSATIKNELTNGDISFWAKGSDGISDEYLRFDGGNQYIEIYKTLDLNNVNLVGANSITINDPGVNEGLIFNGSAGTIQFHVIDDANDNIIQLYSNGSTTNLFEIINASATGNFDMQMQTNANFYMGDTQQGSLRYDGNYFRMTADELWLKSDAGSMYFDLTASLYVRDVDDSDANLLVFDTSGRTLTIGKDNDGVSLNIYGDVAGEYITLFRNWDYTAGNKTTLRLMTADQSAYIVGHRTAANAGSNLEFDVTDSAGTRQTGMIITEASDIKFLAGTYIGTTTGNSDHIRLLSSYVDFNRDAKFRNDVYINGGTDNSTARIYFQHDEDTSDQFIMYKQDNDFNIQSEAAQPIYFRYLIGGATPTNETQYSFASQAFTLGSATYNVDTTMYGNLTVSDDATFTGGNYGIYMNKSGDNNSIRLDSATSYWSYIRFESGNDLFDIGLNDASNSNGDFQIRPDGQVYHAASFHEGGGMTLQDIEDGANRSVQLNLVANQNDGVADTDTKMILGLNPISTDVYGYLSAPQHASTSVTEMIRFYDSYTEFHDEIRIATNLGDTDYLKIYKQAATGALSVAGNDNFKLQVSGGDAFTVTGSTASIDLDTAKLTIAGATGSSGQVLTTDGAGNISWSTVSGGGGSVDPAYRGASGFDETIYEMDLTGFANADVPHFVTSDGAYEEIDTNNYVIVDTSQASSISNSPAISDSKSLKFRRYTEPHSSIAWSMPMKEAAFNFTIEFDIKVSGSNWLRGTYLYFQGWFYDSANDHVTRKTIFYLRKHAEVLEVLGSTSAKTIAKASANNTWVRVKVDCEANNGGAGTNYGKLRASLSTSDTDSFGSTVNWNYTTDESHKMIPTMGFRLATSRGNSSSSYYDELWIDNLTVRTKEGQLL